MSCKVIMITSFKGGVGKSTVAANFALALALSGKKTLLFDCDFRMRSLDILLGCEDKVIYNLGDAVKGNAGIEKIVIKDKRSDNFLFCPAPFDNRDGICSEGFEKVIEEAKKIYTPDYIILDTPGSSGQELSAVTKVCDSAFVVATHNFTSIRAAECTGRDLFESGITDCRLVINQFDMSGKISDRTPSAAEIIDRTGLALQGIIPYDRELSLLQDEGLMFDSLPKKSNTKTAFINMADRTDGKNVPLFSGFKGIRRRKLLRV